MSTPIQRVWDSPGGTASIEPGLSGPADPGAAADGCGLLQAPRAARLGPGSAPEPARRARVLPRGGSAGTRPDGSGSAGAAVEGRRWARKVGGGFPRPGTAGGPSPGGLCNRPAGRLRGEPGRGEVGGGGGDRPPRGLRRPGRYEHGGVSADETRRGCGISPGPSQQSASQNQRVAV